MLGRVYPKAAHKSSRHARDVVPQFKQAAQARPRNAHIWELLGDLLASLEPAGGQAALLHPCPCHTCRMLKCCGMHTKPGALLVLRAALILLWHAYQARLVRRLPASRPAFLGATGALKAYDKAIEIRRKAAAETKAGSAEDGGAEAGQLSARLLNNAAVLHLRSGDARKAYDLMAQALAAAAGGAATDLDPLSQVKGARQWPRRGRSGGMACKGCAGTSRHAT